MFTITACVPERGRVTYETYEENVARHIHSSLMRRQLNPDDFTHDVTITYQEVN